MNKVKVAFICVHNSCRSQIAEALAKHFISDVVEAYSAGTHIKAQINQDAVRLIKDIYHINMEETQRNKLLNEIPSIDIVITMGCNVDCPHLPCQYREDWGLSDPSGQSDEVFKETIATIHEKVLVLKTRIQNNEIKLKG